MSAFRIVAVASLSLAMTLPVIAQGEPELPSLRDIPRPANADLPRLDRRSPLVRMVEAVSPAVVNISTASLVRNPYYSGSLFDRLLGQPGPGAVQKVPNSLGSGVIVDPRGYLVTNEHVIAAASIITVTLLDGRQVEAEFVGSAEDYDLAVLKLTEPGPWPYLSVNEELSLHPGEDVVVIGNPFGHESTVTSGILSGMERQGASGGREYTDFLQTDAAINPGNSGGALLTINGDLIGIPTQIDARAQNIGFAIPVRRVAKVLEDLVRFGEVQRVYLGMTVEDLHDVAQHAPREVARLAVPGNRGLLVTHVWDDLAADRAGLRPGDVILAVDGSSTLAAAEFDTALARIRLGDGFRVELWRDGERVTVSMLAERVPVGRGPAYLQRLLGLSLSDTGRAVVIDRVRKGSEADGRGFVPGLRVLEFGDVKPKTSRDVHEEIFRHLGRRQVWLVVSDGRQAYRVKLRFQST